jgi:hypothetical protein
MCANMARGVGPACQAYNTDLIYTQKKAPRLREGLGWRISNLALYIWSPEVYIFCSLF